MAGAVWPYQREEPVRHLFTRLFGHYGQPRIIRCDHGVPWSSSGLLGLSRLSVWWWSLGIRVEFTAKGHPEQNAAHEQHHRVIKADTLRPPAPTPPAQQQRFQRWRHYYNHQRSHEALKQKTPASRYHPRRKEFTPAPGLPRYPSAHFSVRHHATDAITRTRSRRARFGTNIGRGASHERRTSPCQKG
jgi:transposase InsO family protein